MNLHVLFGLTAASFAAACSNVDQRSPAPADAAPPDPFHVAPHCSSGETRNPNEAEGLEMMPGHACIACHSSIIATGEDAPSFAFGGTAFPSGHEPDDCIGAASEGAHVTVTDESGATFLATANISGNFFVEDVGLAFPITAVVEFNGRKRAMTTPQMSGDCNSCHTSEGDNGAPGRITLP